MKKQLLAMMIFPACVISSMENGLVEINGEQCSLKEHLEKVQAEKDHWVSKGSMAPGTHYLRLIDFARLPDVVFARGDREMPKLSEQDEKDLREYNYAFVPAYKEEMRHAGRENESVGLIVIGTRDGQSVKEAIEYKQIVQKAHYDALMGPWMRALDRLGDPI